MASQAEARFHQLASGSAGMILAEYLKERAQKKLDQLVNCTDATFKHQQGRVLELRELIHEIEKKGE